MNAFAGMGPKYSNGTPPPGEDPVKVGLRKWGTGHRYCAEWSNGCRLWMKRVSEVLGVLSKEALEFFYLKEALNYLKSNWLPNVPYEESERDSILRAARFAHSAVSREARDLGTAIHTSIEEWIDKGKKPAKKLSAEFGPRFDNCWRLFTNWESIVNLRTVKQEFVVWDVGLGVAGTVDNLSENLDTGEDELIDYKTSKGLYKSNGIQMGGYSLMIWRRFGIKVARARLVRIGKDDLVHDEYVIEREDLDIYERIFEGLAQLMPAIKWADDNFSNHNKDFKIKLAEVFA